MVNCWRHRFSIVHTTSFDSFSTENFRLLRFGLAALSRSYFYWLFSLSLSFHSLFNGRNNVACQYKIQQTLRPFCRITCSAHQHWSDKGGEWERARMFEMCHLVHRNWPKSHSECYWIKPFAGSVNATIFHPTSDIRTTWLFELLRNFRQNSLAFISRGEWIRKMGSHLWHTLLTCDRATISSICVTNIYHGITVPYFHQLNTSSVVWI